MLVIFYDNYCPLCTKTKSVLEKVDFFSQLKFTGIRDEQVFLDYPSLDKMESIKRMASEEKGNIVYGFDSVYRIVKKMPQLWLLYPVFLFFKLTGAGDWFYNQIASRRGIMAFSCDENCVIDKP